MSRPDNPKPQSAFSELGMKRTIATLIEEIQNLYLADNVPWVIGYSGGKDSSAVLQLVWLALEAVPADKRQKKVHVISTDTLVEQPLVAAWVVQSHKRILTAAAEKSLPIVPHRLVPEVHNTFWANLIGRGYPAPRNKFRWCTERMKIQPSNNFIRNVVQENGEAILVLGTRKAESQARKRVMMQHEKYRYRDRLSPNSRLPNSLVYTPIEDWSNDDVWLFLMQVQNPWGHDNRSLLTMYQGASVDGECPLVVDTSTPSCGNSRFGCWVCTVVDKDRSMEAMIKNDEEKVWMTLLLELRNELDVSDDRNRRDFRRLSGKVQLFHDRTIPGPYTKKWREHWLRRVLSIQKQIRTVGPKEFSELTLITMDELHEIRRIWLAEKHEFDDAVPRIYKEVTGQDFPKAQDDGAVLTQEDWKLLENICADDPSFFELQMILLDTERQFRGMSRRAGINDALKDCFNRHLYPDEQTAVEALTQRRSRMQKLQDTLGEQATE